MVEFNQPSKNLFAISHTLLWFYEDWPAAVGLNISHTWGI